MEKQLAKLKVGAVLDLFIKIGDDLKRRGITRSANNPVADLSELYFEKALRLTRAPKSTKGYDAIDANGAQCDGLSAVSRRP